MLYSHSLKLCKFLFLVILILVCTFLPVIVSVENEALTHVIEIPISTACTPPPPPVSSGKKHHSRRVVFADDLKGNTHKSMILDERHHIIMDWTPKAACTMMVDMFWNEMNITRGLSYPHNAFVHHYRASFYTKCGTISENMLESDKYYKFKVVRNPFNRAVSSYIHLMKHNLTRSILTGRKGNKKEDDIAVVNLSWDLLSFEEFLHLYDNLKHVRPELESYDNAAIAHFQPQSSEDELKRFNEQQKSIFNRIVHLENFDHEIALVNNDTHMNYSFPERFDSHVVKKTAQPDVYYGNISFAEFRNHRNYNYVDGIPADYGKFYNRRTKALVQSLFANDLKVYNYSFPFAKLY